MVDLLGDGVLRGQAVTGEAGLLRQFLRHVLLVSSTGLQGPPPRRAGCQIGCATRSWPCVATTRALVNSPTFKVLEAFSGGSRWTVPSISGASA